MGKTSAVGGNHLHRALGRGAFAQGLQILAHPPAGQVEFGGQRPSRALGQDQIGNGELFPSQELFLSRMLLTRIAHLQSLQVA
mgnify:CR=1 FL=1